MVKTGLSEAAKKRVRAGRMLLDGKGCAKVALTVGVVRQTLYTWKSVFRSLPLVGSRLRCGDVMNYGSLNNSIIRRSLVRAQVEEPVPVPATKKPAGRPAACCGIESVCPNDEFQKKRSWECVREEVIGARFLLWIALFAIFQLCLALYAQHFALLGEEGFLFPADKSGSCKNPMVFPDWFALDVWLPPVFEPGAIGAEAQWALPGFSMSLVSLLVFLACFILFGHRIHAAFERVDKARCAHPAGR
ncbi:disulfide bond formation protein B [Verminephrobacter eiseniae]|nr:disulfide bond formation protein B [Verminephrobacter eiseniae]MCW5293191.1 disulfide bond formation protein B [Verminephrobacter eiseniae]MCW8186581.1 disulfide bond formation protein B [Verminephrobacter eiseniae]MCW8223943.1 disulfide bond formation protein B [Verminephrobacter eiseniae]MCW8235703.1 disulfide bond formation protein B [Verminephrobacter eiseniae]